MSNETTGGTKASTTTSITTVAPRVLNREEIPSNHLTRENGFVLNGLRGAIEKFMSRDGLKDNEISLGWFFSFTNGEGPVEKITQIGIYNLILTQTNEDGTPDILGLSGNLRLIQLVDLTPEPLIANHYMTSDQTVAASVDEIRVKDPHLKLWVGRDSISSIRGYDSEVGGVLMNSYTLETVGTMLEMKPEDYDFELFFSGAEVNHGEMVSPANQRMRYERIIGGQPDPSVVFTLKAETIYRNKNGNGYYSSADVTKIHSSWQEIMMPGLFVLDTCKIYWRMPVQLLLNLRFFLGKGGLKPYRELMPAFLNSLTPNKLTEFFNNKGSIEIRNPVKK